MCNLGANIIYVGALADKGVKCDSLSALLALRHANHSFVMSTAIPRMFAVNTIIDDVNVDTVDIFRTKVDARMWHRRMGHRNPQALHQLADKDQLYVQSQQRLRRLRGMFRRK